MTKRIENDWQSTEGDWLDRDRRTASRITYAIVVFGICLVLAVLAVLAIGNA